MDKFKLSRTEGEELSQKKQDQKNLYLDSKSLFKHNLFSFHWVWQHFTEHHLIDSRKLASNIRTISKYVIMMDKKFSIAEKLSSIDLYCYLWEKQT